MRSDDVHALSDVRVALVHEWLDDRSGSEKTFEAMARALPHADLFALSAAPDSGLEFDGRAVTTTFLDRPQLRGRRSVSFPLMPLAWSMLKVAAAYDVVITSSHAFARRFRPTARALHLDYCYTPSRYIWMPDLDSRVPAVARPILPALRSLDRRSMKSVTSIVGISTEVADRIRRFYGREAGVIAPPCNTSYFLPDPSVAKQEYVFAVSRHVPYKRLDLAIEAALRSGIPIVIAGDGPQRPALEARYAGSSDVEFVGRVPRDELRDYYRSARALLFPAYEDFGIVPVECMATGTPVVALDRGGAVDTVVDGRSGIRVAEQTATAFAEGLQRVLDDSSLTPTSCREVALEFSEEAFTERFLGWVGGAWADAANNRDRTTARS